MKFELFVTVYFAAALSVSITLYLVDMAYGGKIDKRIRMYIMDQWNTFIIRLFTYIHYTLVFLFYSFVYCDIWIWFTYFILLILFFANILIKFTAKYEAHFCTTDEIEEKRLLF